MELAGEVKNPLHNIPIAILGAVLSIPSLESREIAL
ncbi:MAG: hypothetical protein PSV35_03210 [bacterium]|nr:hypothetical protein [bacterium]